MSALRWAFGALVTTALSVSLDACRPCGQTATETDVGTLVRWDFEPGCADANCGWAGVRGEVRITPLVHPGERGLTLGPSSSATAAVRIADAVASSAVFAPSAPIVRAVVRCDAGTALHATLLVARGADGGSGPDETIEAPSFGSETWSTQSAEFFASGEGATLRRLTLSTSGPGSCQVDQVRLISRDFFSGFCE